MIDFMRRFISKRAVSGHLDDFKFLWLRLMFAIGPTRQLVPIAVKTARQFHRSSNGATAIEYGLIIGLAALAIAGGLGAITDAVHEVFALINTEVENADTKTSTDG